MPKKIPLPTKKYTRGYIDKGLIYVPLIKGWHEEEGLYYLHFIRRETSKGYEDKGLIYVPFEKYPLTASLVTYPLKNIP